MAKGTDNSGDWTAGIVAMVSALLLGGGIPLALYFGLYQPKVEELTQVRADIKEAEVRQTLLSARSQRVKSLEEDGDEMAVRLTELEKDFVPMSSTDPEAYTVADALLDIEDIATVHHLSTRQEPSRRTTARIVAPAGATLEFKDGLKAARFVVEVQARYHDFGRFLAALESHESFTIIPESLLCQGDATRGTRHAFVLQFYIVLKRDIDAIGT